MKKLTALLLAATLIFTLFTGCSSKDKDADIEAKASSNDLYTAFLDDVLEAEVAYDSGIISKDAVYTISQLESATSEFNIQMNNPNEPNERAYAFIDCGADGNPELLVRFTFHSDDWGDFLQYFVLKDYDGQLKLIDEEYSFYRYETVMNEYGYFRCGGSGGATLHGYDTFMLDADGKQVFLNTQTEFSGLDRAGVPREYVPESKKELIPEISFAENTDYYYTAKIYNLVHFDGSSPASDSPEVQNNYDSWLGENFFAFEDSSGNEVMPSAEDMKAYEDAGIKVMSVREAQKLVDERSVELGLTGTIMNGGEPKWKVLE